MENCYSDNFTEKVKPLLLFTKITDSVLEIAIYHQNRYKYAIYIHPDIWGKMKDLYFQNPIIKCVLEYLGKVFWKSVAKLEWVKDNIDNTYLCKLSVKFTINGEIEIL